MNRADSTSGAVHQVSAQTLGPSTFTTEMEEFGRAGAKLTDPSEAEIERAIAEIRNAIRRHSAT